MGYCLCHLCGDQSQPGKQCTIPDCNILCDQRALYPDECTVPGYCKHYCLCRRHYGTLPVCDHVNEPEHGYRASEKPPGALCSTDQCRFTAAGSTVCLP
ncbi:hypothetical protein D3C87_1927680 [compost metagenome]